MIAAAHPQSNVQAVRRIDQLIADRIRAARLEARLSQEKVGELLGLTFQQIQKYERGTNRISPGKLAVLAQILGKNITWFYQGVDTGTSGAVRSIADELMATKGGPRLVSAWLASSPDDQVLSITIAEDFARRALRKSSGAQVPSMAQAAE